MDLISFPNPVAWFESAATGKIERDTLKCILSTLYSAQLTFLFETGRRKLWGEGRALQQTARATYLSLQPLVEKGLLVLTVPQDMLNPDEMAKFQTELQPKKL